ncbi:UBC-like protein [Tilletiopsis washingtonensis]|uniref:Ubiquitin-conjugating enzyme E2 6 n=1 Tax=Tilletiopsis washingtonensis TaxID=58919 RepID=A0A316ZGD7_9BASI|nr:UBC-like protein [Tilletiopsis washingtonensis]PWN99992.1 UBC-like protein [Tilletiopsis washingtonensis]
MSKASNKRLAKESQMIAKDPPPFIFARPREDNILEWHYILRGPPETPFAGGEYWGQVIFPADYPFKPPGIKMSTPSGRFKPDTKICMSMSDFHPGSWNPAWSVATILTGLLSFMVSESPDEAVTTGSINASTADRKALAIRSHAFNAANKKFASVFPEYAEAEMRELPNMGEGTKSEAKSRTVNGAARPTAPGAAPIRVLPPPAARGAAAPQMGGANGLQGAMATGRGMGFILLLLLLAGLFLARLLA